MKEESSSVMVRKLTITDLRFMAASHIEVKGGLLGWVSCTLNGTLCLDGLALRRTLDGRLVLSFPARRDASGRQHAIVRPLDDRARKAVESQIFAALGLEEGAAR